MALREIKSIDIDLAAFGRPCMLCRGEGGTEPPKTYDEVWGQTLINGLMVCQPCDGTGIIGGRST